MDVTFAISVIFTGIVIVFLVLLVLIGIMLLMGVVFAGKKAPPVAPSAPSTPAPPAPPKATPAPIVESGISGGVVAAIAAAISTITGGKGAVASIRRAPVGARTGERSPWARAGLSDNTRPF